MISSLLMKYCIKNFGIIDFNSLKTFFAGRMFNFDFELLTESQKNEVINYLNSEGFIYDENLTL